MTSEAVARSLQPMIKPSAQQPPRGAVNAVSRRARSAADGARTLLSIQYARGVAAVGVLLFHSFNDAQATGYPEQVLQAGVDLFFVISGFIMWVTTQRSSIGPKRFLGKRVRRVVPLYWLFSGVAVLVAGAAPQLGKTTSLQHAVASFLFLPAVRPSNGQVEPVLAPGWTLNHEMLFYLIFAVALTLSSRRLRLGVVIGVNVALSILGWLTHGPLILSFYTNPIILEFVFGVIVGWVYTSGYTMSRRVSTALVSVGGLVMVGCAAAWGQTTILRVIMWGIPAAVIVLALALTENAAPVARRRAWAFVGDGSYSIYLVHGIVLSALLSLVNHVAAPKILMIVVGTPLALIITLCAYQYIERPITRYLSGRRPAGAAVPAAVPVAILTAEVPAAVKR